MSEQKPHWINLTCMKCGYRYSGLTHAAPSACPNDGESLVPYDPPAQRIASLEAELAQVKAERDAQNLVLLTDDWEQTRLKAQRAESAERLCRELAAGLNKLRCEVGGLLHIVDKEQLALDIGWTNIACVEHWAREADALLSRPEVVKLLEEKS